ncbi:two-component system, NarL family, sensor histidine kinase UhpB [Parafrankia irregularis]|uniref:histidine kinase n=1 Tax=Parafrankia irregularis TaxID=795642 RepID=A0A0S4QRW1_9ACTN|nr:MULTISPECIES: histidine kinase [Parafrankia]CUU58352.1 two-component system, NarL family, sensor histidine kinase UhpB [Parafrankia irregularis]
MDSGDCAGTGWGVCAAAEDGDRAHGLTLFWRVFALNAAVFTAAMLGLMLGPVTVSTPVVLTEVLILIGGLAAMLVTNAALLRVALRPIDRLIAAVSTIDLSRPGHRMVDAGQAGPIGDLVRTFNAMLDRLEAERAASTARALTAQEAERQRIAQELHDEIGQTLTAVLLELKSVADSAPPPLRTRLRQVQETTRNGLDEIRRIARRLRPGVLEELGLTSALKALAGEFTTGGLVVHHSVERHLGLGRDAELVLYRVAQECLTNTARHAGARQARLEVARRGTGIELRVRDDGRGLGGAAEGSGIGGMRERALLIGADLTIGPAAGGGTEVRLWAPLPEEPPVPLPEERD